jgi:hypothetical protein
MVFVSNVHMQKHSCKRKSIWYHFRIGQNKVPYLADEFSRETFRILLDENDDSWHNKCNQSAKILL